MEHFIPLSVPNLNGNELQYVTEAVKTEWLSTGGACISRFEQEFAEYAQVPEATAVQSGTAALHLSMIACGIGAGDLVIAPTLTFIAAVNPICYVGAEPVFMDCDDSLCIDPVKLEQYLSEECEERGGKHYDKMLDKPVKAIVIVHIFGNGADMERIMVLAALYNLPVIEDASEAVGTFFITGKYKGQMAGTIGNYGTYSFNGNKIITTGGGGMLVARKTEHVKYAKHLSTQAKSDELYFDHDYIGYNYRMTNLQAAVGVAQLEQLAKFINVKKRNYEYYKELGIDLMPFSNHVRPNYWFYSYMSDNLNRLMKHLEKCHVQARPVWKLIHTLPMYKHCRTYDISEATKYHKKIINIPCSSNLRNMDVERVAALIKGFEE